MLPFKILNTGLQGVKWAFQNAGGLIPLAGYLVMEDLIGLLQRAGAFLRRSPSRARRAEERIRD